MAWMTPAEWARQQGFSRQYAHQLIQSGLIERHEGKIDEAQANAAVAAKRELTRPENRAVSASLPASAGEKSLNQLWLKARIKNEMEKGKLLALKIREQQGEVVAVSEVNQAGFTTARVVRDQLLAIPGRISHQLASLTDAAAIDDQLTSEIRNALACLSQPDFPLPAQAAALPDSTTTDSSPLKAKGIAWAENPNHRDDQDD